MQKGNIAIQFIESALFVSRMAYSMLTGKERSTLSPNRLSKADKDKYVRVEIFARQLGSDNAPVKIGESDLFRV